MKKKSPFEKHKEEIEAKKKVCSPLQYLCKIMLTSIMQQADDEAAKVYEEFVASFSGDAPKSKAFVRGETFIPPNSIVPTTPASPVPVPPIAQAHLEVPRSKPGLSATLSAFSAFSDSGPEPVFILLYLILASSNLFVFIYFKQSPKPLKKEPQKKKRSIDELKEELKR